MRDSSPSLYAYIFTSFCVIIFYILKWEEFITVVKPVIVPAIYYYYVQTTKRPINTWFTVAIWLFFIADMIEIVDAKAGLYWIMACSLMSYIIMFRFALLDKVKFNFSWKSIFITIAIIAFIAVLSAQVIGQTNTSNTIYFYFFAIYTITLLSMISYGMLRLFSNNDVASRLFLSMVGVMFLSDFLYASNKYVEYNMPRAIMSFLAQFTSYYFMVEYFNVRVRSKLKV